MKRPIETALWDDCESDRERVAFLRSGRAWDTGIIAKILIEDVARAFEDRDRLRAEVERLRAENINLFDTVLAAMCAAVGKPVITIKESTEDQISDLQKEVCSLGEKLSAIITSLRSDARLGAMVRRMPPWKALFRWDKSWQACEYQVVPGWRNSIGECDTPEEALEKAGCGEVGE